MLKEIGLSASRKLKESKALLVYVARNKGNNELAPSEQLLRDFKSKNRGYGDTTEAHNKAFREVGYENIFRNEILNNPLQYF